MSLITKAYQAWRASRKWGYTTDQAEEAAFVEAVRACVGPQDPPPAMKMPQDNWLAGYKAGRAEADDLRAFCRRACDGTFRIVCTADLTPHQIAEAGVQGRMFVDPNGMGLVLLPWTLTTDKDRLHATKENP